MNKFQTRYSVVLIIFMHFLSNYYYCMKITPLHVYLYYTQCHPIITCTSMYTTYGRIWKSSVFICEMWNKRNFIFELFWVCLYFEDIMYGNIYGCWDSWVEKFWIAAKWYYDFLWIDLIIEWVWCEKCL